MPIFTLNEAILLCVGTRALVYDAKRVEKGNTLMLEKFSGIICSKIFDRKHKLILNEMQENF